MDTLAEMQSNALGTLQCWFQGYTDQWDDGFQRKVTEIVGSPNEDTTMRVRLERQEQHGLRDEGVFDVEVRVRRVDA